MSPTLSKPPPADWLLWQLADSAFPSGGFAHSAGLEAAWQHGEIRNASDLVSFCEASLEQLGHASLPFVNAVHLDPGKLNELDLLCDAFTSNHVANRASRLQGRAFLASATRIFNLPEVAIACGHFAPVFGAVLRLLEVSSQNAGELFFFTHLRGILASAVRLGIVGPMEAQSWQHRLSLRAGEVLARCGCLGIDDFAQTAPLIDLWQGTQDRLYSRLFQS